MSKTMCPKCFEESEQAVYACQTPDCEELDIPQQAAPSEEGAGPVCHSCGKPLTVRLCPLCGFPLEEEPGKLPNLPFTIIGASGCGKSNFLSVLIHQIRQEMGKGMNCSLYPLGGDNTIQLYDRLYHHPLFVEGRVPLSTETDDIEPLGYSLVFSGAQPKGKTCCMSFYDSCGSSLDSERLISRHNRSLPATKGLFLLIDPSQFPELREHFLTQGKPVLDADVTVLLDRIVHVIRSSTGLTDMNQKIPIPIAICLTKMDTFAHLLDTSSFVAHSPRHLRRPGLDRIDAMSCNLEVQSLVQSWAGKTLINQIRAQFSHACFFAFSALGSQPDVETGEITRISPHRVLDPLLWMLWRRDIIECL